MKKFEYCIIDVASSGFWGGEVNADELTNTLNELGREGWELVSAVDTDYSGGGTKKLMLMLKREIA